MIVWMISLRSGGADEDKDHVGDRGHRN